MDGTSTAGAEPVVRSEDGGLAAARHGALGLVRLERPKALNALSRAMIVAMADALAAFAADDRVRAVAITAVPGRAFSAGGDIREIRDGLVAGDPGITGYYRDEYRMNAQLAGFAKPTVALVDGWLAKNRQKAV